MNDNPLQINEAGVVWVLVLDSDQEPVLDLTSGGVSNCKAIISTGPAGSAGPHTINVASSPHELITTRAPYYGIPFPASGGTYNLNQAPVEISVVLTLTAHPAAFASRKVIDPAAVLSTPLPADVLSVLGEPINDLVDGALDVYVSAIDPVVAQALSDLTKKYDIIFDDNAVPRVATMVRKSDRAIVAEWNVTRETQNAVTAMWDPNA